MSARNKYFLHSPALGWQNGQTVLILTLVMAVGLTVGLSAIARSVTDIGSSKESEDAAIALSVAEAGIEEALKLGSAPVSPVQVGGSFTAVVKESAQGGGGNFVFPDLVEAGATRTLWLIGHDDTGNPDPTIEPYSDKEVDLYWAESGTYSGGSDCSSSNIPAIEATVLYVDNAGNFKIFRQPLDPDVWRRANCTNFGVVTDTGGGYELGDRVFQYRATINLPLETLYLMSLKLLFNPNPQPLGVSVPSGSSSNLPSQGKCYTSTATLTSGVIKRVEHCQLFKSPPNVLSNVLYGDVDISKTSPPE